jgi:hypothetical protein
VTGRWRWARVARPSEGYPSRSRDNR